ncbi:uncharacterized protein LOC131639346 [Vicia villosa]|uniref:uncharacterized protein LOC131639346 n=1 Tax=Vicia villosa TaxID=3911 RepID=UPI00273AFD87|nr:uncharacterized protein LOC131639346 [Vicia villosa]
MASCNFGTQNVKVLNLHFGQKRVGLLQHFGPRSWISRKPLQYTSLVASPQTVRYLTSSNEQSQEIEPVSKSVDGSEEIKPSGLTSNYFPNFNEVEFLLTNLCDTTSIAELELKLDGFHLRVVRGLTENTTTLPLPILAPESINSTDEVPQPNGLVSTSSSLTIFKPAPSSISIQGFLDKAADEGLVIIQSPKVGYFRTSRTIKGKRAPSRCKEMHKVEEGKVICYIEQLGGQLPVQSDVSGEIIKILREDGDHVGYGDALIAVLPSFPGIKTLQ